MSASEESRALELILSRRRLSATYQATVDLETAEVVGFEAFVRGPERSTLETPAALFGAARRSGLSVELEWQCRAAAIQGALDAGLTPRTTLFVNADPSLTGATAPADLDALIRVAERRLRLAFDVTERDLCRQPLLTLAFVRAARRRWWGVALDGLGAGVTSLSLLPLLEPDVIKVDQRLLSTASPADRRAVLETVAAQQRHAGAALLVKGVETEAHLLDAHSIGASLAQGMHLGPPGPLVAPGPSTRSIRLRPADEDAPSLDGLTDRIAATGQWSAVSGDGLADALGRAEKLLRAAPYPGVLLVWVGAPDRLTDETVARLGELAGTAALAAVVAPKAPEVAGTRLACAPLPPGGGAESGWYVVATTPSASLTVAGVDRYGQRPGGAELAVSSDLRTAVGAARTLVQPLLDHV